jgi:uncharacterized protein YjbI with pentapeptide repeats
MLQSNLTLARAIHLRLPPGTSGAMVLRIMSVHSTTLDEALQILGAIRPAAVMAKPSPSFLSLFHVQLNPAIRPRFELRPEHSDLRRVPNLAAELSALKAHYPDSIIDLTGANMRRVNLRNVDLRDASLGITDLRNADLSGAKLTRATLYDADLRGVNLVNTDLRQSALTEADLTSADLRNANLEDTQLSSTNFVNADLSSANLNGAQSFGADLRGANLSHASLQKIELQWARLQKADLSNANLTGADLNFANLERANLKHATLSGALVRDTNFASAIFFNTDLRGAEFFLPTAIFGKIKPNDLQAAEQVLANLLKEEPALHGVTLLKFNSANSADVVARNPNRKGAALPLLLQGGYLVVAGVADQGELSSATVLIAPSADAKAADGNSPEGSVEKPNGSHRVLAQEAVFANIAKTSNLMAAATLIPLQTTSMDDAERAQYRLETQSSVNRHIDGFLGTERVSAISTPSTRPEVRPENAYLPEAVWRPLVERLERDLNITITHVDGRPLR